MIRHLNSYSYYHFQTVNAIKDIAPFRVTKTLDRFKNGEIGYHHLINVQLIYKQNYLSYYNLSCVSGFRLETTVGFRNPVWEDFSNLFLF